MSTDHPWNAELLHINLGRRRLADRDAFWTVWLNHQSDNIETAVGRLIDWCLSGQVPHTNRQNQFLAALTLCWFFASSNRRIRDKATKALTSLLITRADLFPDLLARFKEVDDLYVLERLLAAAFGASCRDKCMKRLTSYSSSIFHSIFANGSPPLGLLLRDYAYGIIELAKYHDVLAEQVNFDLCKPPYKSKVVRFIVDEEKLEALAERAGGKEILRSTTVFMGDFARYEAEPRVNRFLSAPLSKTAPLTPDQRLKIFENDIVRISKTRAKAFEKLRNNANPYSYGIIMLFGGALEDIDQSEIDKWQRDIEKSENEFLVLLSKDEIKRFKVDAAPSLYDEPINNKKSKEIDIAAATRWIANRAYRLGWSARLFPGDYSQSGRHLRDRPVVERIGKKYQWIALDELTCRLADNNWLSGEFYDLPRPYANPIDVGFDRDIDPTIIEEKERREPFSEYAWAMNPKICLKDVSENELPSWPFEEDPAVKLKDLVVRQDNNGLRWVVLYEHQSKTDKYSVRIGGHGTRQQEFRFLMSAIVRRNEIKQIVEKIAAGREIDAHSWGTLEKTDEAFLFEAPWRNTWPNSQWRFDCWHAPEGVGVAFPVYGYCWESHLDASLSEGFRTHLPSSWLSKELSLRPDLKFTGIWVAPNGEIIFREISGDEGGVICLIREDMISKVLAKDLCILSLLIAERNAWPGGSNYNASWRRVEGLCWHDGNELQTVIWKRDNGNGTSIKYVRN